MKTILPILAACLFFSGCQSSGQKHRELVNQGIAQIDESLKHGRVDLARKYASTLRAANPSKTVVSVKDFDDGSKKYVVLPVDYDGKPLLTLDSPEYKEVLEQNKALKEQVAQEVEQFQKYEKKTQDSIRAANEKLESERRSGFWGWFFALGSFGTVAGLIAVCIFFPAAQPLIAGVLQSFVSGVESTFKMVGSLFKRK